ncbi:hypothetical protein [Tenacibaculum agarivorans]|uniref:hypothetical protein n=1 Tax=Tenacibaculum agarivorans TaxID=1908389 RepID=UPI00094B854B|nr:hypothetical protein [Tenacibaculum agarivorans]
MVFSTISNFIGDGIGNLFDFDCIGASFSPEKAEPETRDFIAKLKSRFNLDFSINSNNAIDAESSANQVLKILDYMSYWRKKTGDGREGCTREGEYLSANIAKQEADSLIQKLESRYSVTISNETGVYKSGFRGAPSRSTPYRKVTLKNKTISTIPVKPVATIKPDNSDTLAPSLAPPPIIDVSNFGDKDKNKETSKSGFIWVILGFILLVFTKKIKF